MSAQEIEQETSQHITLQDLINLRKRYSKFVKDAGKAAIKEEFKQFFKDNPQFEGFTWEQYTPHFNDGSPCVFTVYTPRFKARKTESLHEGSIEEIESDINFDTTSFMSDLPDDEDEDDEEDWVYSDGLRPQELKEAAETLVARLEAAGDVLETIFGDGTTITVTPTAIKTEELEYHD